MVVVENNENVPEEDRKRVARTQEIINEHRLDAKVIWHDVRGATTADARASLGVDASDIAKSILFIAKPDEVLKHTGTEVGGVTPLGCDHVPKYLDKSLLEKEYVHASAGSSYATLLIKTKDLIEYTKGNIVDVAEQKVV